MPLFDFVCGTCGTAIEDRMFKNAETAKAAKVRCPNCMSAAAYIPCQGRVLSFRPYVMDNIPGDPVIVSSYREEKVLKQLYKFEHKSKIDCKASVGLVGWPMGRRRIATIVNGEVKRHACS